QATCRVLAGYRTPGTAQHGPSSRIALCAGRRGKGGAFDTGGQGNAGSSFEEVVFTLTPELARSNTGAADQNSGRKVGGRKLILSAPASGEQLRWPMPEATTASRNSPHAAAHSTAAKNRWNVPGVGNPSRPQVLTNRSRATAL